MNALIAFSLRQRVLVVLLFVMMLGVGYGAYPVAPWSLAAPYGRAVTATVNARLKSTLSSSGRQASASRRSRPRWSHTS